jgi:hypothetical protein
MEKPLKRLRNDMHVNTGLKPGENEIEDFWGQSPVAVHFWKSNGSSELSCGTYLTF